ncbi:MAG: Fic family protein [Mycoplasmataceae bacterium]|nr:Fic family protein [Mycoplasmataceae bacterium]
MNKISIRFYNDKEVRAVWNEKENEWYFSIFDILSILNKENDYKKVRNYWKYLKAKLLKEKNQLVSDTIQLKLKSIDNKTYFTDCINSKGLIELAKNLPNTNAKDFLEWFLYSEKSIDGQSKKKAYQLFEANLINDKDIGKTKSLLQIHNYIFAGLYDFAGKIRNQNISKGGFKFCSAMFLEKNLEEVSNMPQKTYNQIINKYVEMNIIHPFLEGNGRSARIWLDLIFKKELRKCVDWSKIDKKEYLEAMIESHISPTKIQTLIKEKLTDKINDREIFMKGIDYSYYYEE